jgi:predicted CoA-binding protein
LLGKGRFLPVRRGLTLRATVGGETWTWTTRSALESLQAPERSGDGSRGHLIQDEAGIRAVVQASKRVAVLGIKTEQQSDQPAFYVREYLAQAGVDVVPVPIYYPDVTHISASRCSAAWWTSRGHRPGGRVPTAPGHRPARGDILAKKPRAVWFQSGIRNDAGGGEVREGGIKVVQSRCLMVDHRRYGPLKASASSKGTGGLASARSALSFAWCSASKLQFEQEGFLLLTSRMASSG